MDKGKGIHSPSSIVIQKPFIDWLNKAYQSGKETVKGLSTITPELHEAFLNSESLELEGFRLGKEPLVVIQATATTITPTDLGALFPLSESPETLEIRHMTNNQPNMPLLHHLASLLF